MSVLNTGGNWSRQDAPLYFLASNVSRHDDVAGHYPWLLCAVNELEGPAGLRHLEDWISKGARVLLDSGVFWLASSNAKKRGMSFYEALALPPEQLEGFVQLWDQYLHIVRTYGDQLWGYVEFDQGGVDNKRRLRAHLNDLGLNPIPVYHPLTDGWDYFDELASTHDRMCFGNVVNSDADTRIRLAATAWERRRRYPHLWVHLLGYTPDERMCAFPVDSADSSTWLAPVRWPVAATVRCAGKSMGPMHPGLRYRLGADRYAPDGATRATLLSMLNCAGDLMNWKAVLRDYQRHLGADWRGQL